MSPGQAARFILFERYRDANAALEHFASIAPLMETATITGEYSARPTSKSATT